MPLIGSNLSIRITNHDFKHNFNFNNTRGDINKKS